MFHYFFLEQIFAKPIKDVGGKKLKDWRNSPANILSLVSRRNARGVVFNQLASAERDPHNGKDKKVPEWEGESYRESKRSSRG